MLVDSWDPELAQHVFRAVDLAGVLCNGIIGGKLARDRKFDYVGFGILAIMSALGGGICRDVMLNQVPVAITDPFYLGTALFGAFVAFLWKMESRVWQHILTIADSLCLGCWAATGAAKALGLGFAVGPALLMGVITAVGGGMIRDITSGRIPLIFARNNLYVTPALISAILMVIMWKSELPVIGMALASISSTLFVGVSIKKRWELPEAPEITVTLSARQLINLLRTGTGKNNPNYKNENPDKPEKQNYKFGQSQPQNSPYQIIKNLIRFKIKHKDSPVAINQQSHTYESSYTEELKTLENALENAGMNMDSEKITIEINQPESPCQSEQL